VRIEPRERPSLGLLLAAPAIAVAGSLALSGGLIHWAGGDVPAAYAAMLDAAAGSGYALAETLARATPLIFTGLAAAVAFRARLWNIGGEGQLYAGALAAVTLGSGAVDLPAWLLIPLLLAVGFIAGGLLLLGPALLRLRYGVDEVVTTLLSNFVVLLFVSWTIDGPLKDPASFGWPQSQPVVDAGTLPALFAGGRVHLGLPLALAAALLVAFLTARTVWGFELRAVGASPRAARFAGVPVDAALLRVAALSGGLAGLAGVAELCGTRSVLTTDLSPGYGYVGIVVATLALLEPLAAVAAAVFIAGVFVGADGMSRAVGIPGYIADVIVSTALLVMLVAVLLSRYRLRRG